MVVDDDDINNFLCARIIEKTGHANDIKTCTGAAEALTLLKDCINNSKECPDLIFLDINMPVKNGWDFLDEFVELKDKLKKEVIIVLLSSTVYPNDIERASHHEEVATFTSKPLTIQKVEEIVKNYL